MSAPAEASAGVVACNLRPRSRAAVGVDLDADRIGPVLVAEGTGSRHGG